MKCKEENCITVLNSWNKGLYCFVHQAMRVGVQFENPYKSGGFDVGAKTDRFFLQTLAEYEGWNY